MSRKLFDPTPEMDQVLRQAGSLVKEESLGATAELAKALELPLRRFDTFYVRQARDAVALQAAMQG